MISCFNLIAPGNLFSFVHVVLLTLLRLCLGSSVSQLPLSIPFLPRHTPCPHQPFSRMSAQTSFNTPTPPHHTYTHTSRLSRMSWHQWGTVVVCVWQRSQGNGIPSLPGYKEQTDHLSPSRGPDEIDLFILIISGLNVFYECWFNFFPYHAKGWFCLMFCVWCVSHSLLELIHSRAHIKGCLETFQLINVLDLTS